MNATFCDHDKESLSPANAFLDQLNNLSNYKQLKNKLYHGVTIYDEYDYDRKDATGGLH